MTRGRNAVSVHHCARRRVGIVADYNRVRKYVSQMNSGKTRTATVPQQPMRDSHRLNTVDNISSPRQCTRLVNCHELAGTCDTRQATEIKPAKNISQTDHLHSRPVCHHHGMSRKTLGNKDAGEVSGLDPSPSLFIYYLFLQSSLVFFFRPLPPSSSTPPCFLFFFLLFTWGSVHCTICWLLLHLATVASPLLYFFPPTLPIFSRTY